MQDLSQSGWLIGTMVLVFGVAFHVAMIVTFKAFAKKQSNRKQWAVGTLVLMCVFLSLFFKM